MPNSLIFNIRARIAYLKIGKKNRRLLKSVKTPEDYLKQLADNWVDYKPSPLTVTDKDAGALPEASELFCQLGEYHIMKKQYDFQFSPDADDLTNTLNIMQWLTDHTCYCGCTSTFCPDDAVAILRSSVDKGFSRALNCRYKALAFADILIAYGMKALPVCMLSDDGGCHFTVQVFIRELNKFMVCDPSFNCYFTNAFGTPLSVFELREAVIENKVVNIIGYSLFGKKQLEDMYFSVFIKDCLANISTWQTNKRTKKTKSTLFGIDFKSAVPKSITD